MDTTPPAEEQIATAERWQCPYCLKPVGIFGNWLAAYLGTHIHGCDSDNMRIKCDEMKY